MQLRWLVVVAGGITVGLGCAAPPDESGDEPGDHSGEEGVGEAQDAIQGGYADNADTAVVGIAEFNQGGICTGSLLAPNMVLTARHCVSNTLNQVQGGVSCSVTTTGNPFAGSAFGVTTKQNMFQTTFNDWVDVIEVVTLPTDNKFCGQDQAILILKDNIPPEQAVPLTPRVDSALAKGEIYSAAGYGQASDNNQNSAGQRRRRDNLEVQCAELECPPGVEAYVKDSEWIGDTGICSGDSGGPALDAAGRVVGVTSRGGPNCTSPVYGSVHSWADWIKETAIHAAQLGGYEPPNWALGWPTDPSFNLPVGEACDEVDCPICYNNVCTRFCSEAAACPSGYECKGLEDGNSVCAKKPKKKKKASSEETEVTSCSTTMAGTMAGGDGTDPTNPVPWMLGGGALALFAARRRYKPRAE